MTLMYPAVLARAIILLRVSNNQLTEGLHTGDQQCVPTVEKEYPHKQRWGSRSVPRKKQRSLETELIEEEILNGEGGGKKRRKERRRGVMAEEKEGYIRMR